MQTESKNCSFIHFNMKYEKVFQNGPSEICGRQPLQNLKCNGLLKHTLV